MSDVARGAASNYKVMNIEDIKNLPIKDITDPDGAILALWVPSSMLQDGLDTMKAWGFNQKQTYIWVKSKIEPLAEFNKLFKLAVKKLLNKDYFSLLDFKEIIKKAFDASSKSFNMTTMLSFGMGRLFRQSHEICLIGTNNNKIYKSLLNKSQRSVSFAQNMKHSSKPEDLQNSLDIMFPNVQNKIELFARRNRTGWTCLGNEVCNGEDIRVSLAKL